LSEEDAALRCGWLAGLPQSMASSWPVRISHLWASSQSVLLLLCMCLCF
jgi:hypothetical protein